VTGSLDGRPPAPVESAAYFAVSELLANVAKHAGAQSADIDLRHSLGALRISVRDDGDAAPPPAGAPACAASSGGSRPSTACSPLPVRPAARP